MLLSEMGGCGSINFYFKEAICFDEDQLAALCDSVFGSMLLPNPASAADAKKAGDKDMGRDGLFGTSSCQPMRTRFKPADKTFIWCVDKEQLAPPNVGAHCYTLRQCGHGTGKETDATPVRLPTRFKIRLWARKPAELPLH